jgi:predicted RNA methylase
MSNYAEYESLSNAYDNGRSAVGSEWYVASFLTKLEAPLTELHVLDAGCGTGNYARALLDAGVSKVGL